MIYGEDENYFIEKISRYIRYATTDSNKINIFEAYSTRVKLNKYFFFVNF